MASSDNQLLSNLHSLRIIPYRKFPGAKNMTIDSYFAHNCRENSQAVLRFYGWEPYCLSLGVHQKETYINFNKLKEDGVDFVKRPTGGRAIFHADELTYSIVISRSTMEHRGLYRFVHLLFQKALNQLDYAVELLDAYNPMPELHHNAVDFPCFTKSAWTEIQYDRKKLIGSAQRIYPNSVLQHGSILIGEKHKQLIKYLSIDHITRQRMAEELDARTISLREILNKPIRPEELMNTIINQLEKNTDCCINCLDINGEEMIAINKFRNSLKGMQKIRQV